MTFSRVNILMASRVVKNGRLTVGRIRDKSPMCSKCGVDTRSHVSKGGRIYCHKCWLTLSEEER